MVNLTVFVLQQLAHYGACVLRAWRDEDDGNYYYALQYGRGADETSLLDLTQSQMEQELGYALVFLARRSPRPVPAAGIPLVVRLGRGEPSAEESAALARLFGPGVQVVTTALPAALVGLPERESAWLPWLDALPCLQSAAAPAASAVLVVGQARAAQAIITQSRWGQRGGRVLLAVWDETGAVSHVEELRQRVVRRIV